jgi:hypothetical protein
MRVLLIFLVVVVGCSGGKTASNEAHFKKTVVPVLESDLKAILPSSGAVAWTGHADRTEQDGLAPIPRTIGHSYIAIGTVSGMDVTFEGEYEPKNPGLVFTKIRLSAKGHWDEAGFPTNALALLGFDPSLVALFAPVKYENNSVYVQDKGVSYEIQPMGTSFETDASGKRTGEVTAFELLVMEPKKR